MKSFIAAAIAATFIAAAPAWAGHDDHRGWSKHEWKEHKHREKEWRKAQKHAWKHHRHETVVVQQAGPVFVERHVQYVQPRAVYYAPPAVVAAPAAINIHIPIR
jgi:hypothetical protein